MNKIVIYTGPMFAGKSTALINEIKLSKNNDNEKIMFNYADDKRYNDNADIATHNKEIVKSIPITNCFEINKYITNEIKEIYIDEIQFIDSVVNWLATSENYLLQIEKIVIAGLNYDVYGNYFNEQFNELINYCQYSNNNSNSNSKVNLLRADCYISSCNKKADFTILLDENNNNINEENNVLVGSKDIYQPSCLIHALERPYKHNFAKFMIRY